MSPHDAGLERLRRALDELADAETSSIVAEARIEARARVRAMLADAMAERMLERAERQLASEPGEDVQESRAAADSTRGEEPAPSRAVEPAGARELGRYVYGIVEQAFDVPPLDGVQPGHGLELVRGSGLGALTSSVSLDEFGEEPLRERLEDLAWLERHARLHEQVLEVVRRRTTSVIPMRLFTIYANDASVRDMLARERDFLSEALAYLTRRSEWGVKLFANGQPDQDGAADDDARASGPGERYLLDRRAAGRRAEEIARELEERREDAHRRLASLAVEAKANPLQPPELAEHEGTMVMNGVYLVDDDAADDFCRAVSTLRSSWADEAVEVVLTGPWPPYNFVHAAREPPV